MKGFKLCRPTGDVRWGFKMEFSIIKNITDHHYLGC